MYDFSQGFKLCTCSNLDIKKLNKAKISHWVLKHWQSQNWMDAEIGRCFYPKFSENDLENAEFIGYYLNTENCFDFDFLPQEKDTLNFTIFRESLAENDLPLKFEFEFSEGEWRFIELISEHFDKNWRIGFGKILIESENSEI